MKSPNNRCFTVSHRPINPQYLLLSISPLPGTSEGFQALPDLPIELAG